MKGTLAEEIKEATTKVGYMERWLRFQQTNHGFEGKSLETTEWFVANIRLAGKYKQSIYKKNQGLDKLKADAATPAKPTTHADVEAAVGRILLWSLQISYIWALFQDKQTTDAFPFMPVGRTKKDREVAQTLGFEYDPEKFA